ncbi:MAG: ABC transporter permease [Proteobacteria bacterium]|nr:ABC transporter permease [Pseudomonadota bacterium]
MNAAPRRASDVARRAMAAIGAAALVVVLIAVAAVLAAMAAGPAALSALRDALASSQPTFEALANAPILALTGLATMIALRCGLTNLGAEGQLLAGALAAIAVTTAASGAVSVPLVVAAILAGALAGALLMGFAAVVKSWLGAEEAVVTLILNVIATFAAAAAAGQPLQLLPASGLRQTVPFAGLPLLSLDAGMALASGALLAGLACVTAAAILRYTVVGLELRAVGGNAIAARFAGVRVARYWLATGVVAGACAGVAGAMMAVGIGAGTTAGVSTGLGYAGIAVALLSGRSALAVLIWAPCVSAIMAMADLAARVAALPAATGDLAVALLILFALAASMAPPAAARRAATDTGAR